MSVFVVRRYKTLMKTAAAAIQESFAWFGETDPMFKNKQKANVRQASFLFLSYFIYVAVQDKCGEMTSRRNSFVIT